MTTELLALRDRVQTVGAVANSVTASIVGTPTSWLDDFLERIKSVLEGIRDAIVNAIVSKLEGIGTWVDNIVKAVEQFATGIVSRIGDIINTVKNALENFLSGIVATFQDIITTLKSYIATLMASWAEVLGDFYNTVRDFIGDLIARIREFVSGVVETLKEFLGNAWTAIKNAVTATWERIREFAQNVAQTVQATVGNIVNIIKTWAEGIWQRILQVVRDVYDKVVAAGEWVRDKAIPFLKAVYTDTKEGIDERLAGARMIVEGMASGDGNAVVAGILKVITYREPTDITSILAGAMAVQAVAPQGVAASLQGPLRVIAQRSIMQNPVEPLPTSVLGEAVARGFMAEGDAGQELLKQGIPGGRIGILAELARKEPSPGAVQEAFVRGLINEQKHDSLLARAGYRPEDIRMFKALYWVIPPLSDIIRMAVREAFTPDVAKKFGQYEDFPKDFAYWAERQGLTKEWAERYWAAHWDLPSAQMGFEMLHRRIIDKDELKMLLRALDVMPFWREKLIQLSYNPYTRVDLRRMYQMGILSEQDVFNAYLDLGYDEEKARNLTAFTVKYYAPEDKTELDEYKAMARSIYVRAFKLGLIGRDDCRKYLEGIGYRTEDAEFLVRIAEAELELENATESKIPQRTQVTNLVIDAFARGIMREDEVREVLSDLNYSDAEVDWYIALTEYQRTQSAKKFYVETIHQNYVNRTIDKGEASAILGRIYPYATELERFFEIWDLEREARTRKPTEAQFRAAWAAGIISEDEYREELRGLGFPEKYVDMLTELARRRAQA